nr:hypothetical protein [Nannocystis exedens]
MKSRCTRPSAWVAASPRPAWMNRSSSAAGSGLGAAVSHARSEQPLTYSIARKICPSRTLASWICTTLGCDSRASASASCRIRAVADGPARSARMVLIATARPSSSSNAVYTTPMPPWPICRTSV